MRTCFAITIAAVMMVTATTSAKTKKHHGAKLSVTPYVDDFDDPILNDKFYKKLVTEIKQEKRSTAQSETDVPAQERHFENDFLNLRSEINGGPIYKDQQATEKTVPGVKSPEDLDQLITKVFDSTYYASLTPQAQFLALQLRSLAPFKGIIFRAKNYIGRHTASRSFIVTFLRTAATGTQVFFPGQTSANHQWDIVFRYLTEPMAGMGGEISTDEQLERYLAVLVSSARDINRDFGKIVQMNKPLYWDNKIYLPFANFSSEKDRYIKIGIPEQQALFSVSCMNMSALLATSAYSLNGLQGATKDFWKAFGVDVINPLQVSSGLSSEERFDILEKYSSLFVLKADGQSRMSGSYKYLVASIRWARAAWDEVKKTPQDTDNVLDPRVILPFNRVIGTSFERLAGMIDGDGNTKSTVVNGEVITVDLKKFFTTNSPQKLSVLYPVRFDEGSRNLSKIIDGKKVSYRNYHRGSAKFWSYQAYKPYFPDIKPAQGSTTLTDDVPRHVRVLSQTWGAAGFAVPLTAVVF
ncbi:MAG: hypothetical protein COT73_10160 [Bdellovibrio sp. CG10_big_fil_rev_8_21_14_0_10_47_8]|nr:MAG: hypothetical protein COT73_10160 [Bdellovibrio sp. CG10_big_fil_rev_8_21_14_0_10_47_8]